ncbi:MAG: hypothetical protein Q8Q50_03500 [Methylobacter sp.]|nr:hypothetical protein [Methylobacter sp.]
MYAYIRDGVVAHIATSNGEYLQGVEAVVPCDELVTVGMLWDGTAFGRPSVVAAYPKVSPVEFKLLFTSSERVAIKAIRPTDAIVDDFYDIMDDPRLTEVDLALQSVQAALGYLTALGMLAAGRREDILLGVVQ